MGFTLTKEQQDIVDAGRDLAVDLIIQAGAGCAKTSTLTFLSQALPTQPGLILAFNVRIREAIEKLVPKHFNCLTLNSLGHRAWAKAIGRNPQVADGKLGKIVTAISKAEGHPLSQDDWDGVRRAVGEAMNVGMVPSQFPFKSALPDAPESWLEIMDRAEANPDLWPLVRLCLCESIKQSFAGIISYDDQIYCSAMLGGVFPKYPLVMVDEAQDLSFLNHRQISKTASGRLIVVGDPRQAIYSFRGADSNSMTNLRALRPEWLDLPLNITFRCPKAIVARNVVHAPGFTAWHTNPEGEIKDWRGSAWDPGQLPVEGFVLCRNNAPILSLAFKLIRAGRGVNMLGRDIGRGLVALSKKVLPDPDMSPAEAIRRVQAWIEGECALAIANDKEGKCEGIEDRGESLIAVLGACRSVRDLQAKLEDLFSPGKAKLTLGSIHRAKGLEESWVMHLDPWRIPSKWARGESLAQEANLQYVCETRTRHTLVLANLEDFHEVP